MSCMSLPLENGQKLSHDQHRDVKHVSFNGPDTAAPEVVIFFSFTQVAVGQVRGVEVTESQFAETAEIFDGAFVVHQFHNVLIDKLSVLISTNGRKSSSSSSISTNSSVGDGGLVLSRSVSCTYSSLAIEDSKLRNSGANTNGESSNVLTGEAVLYNLVTSQDIQELTLGWLSRRSLSLGVSQLLLREGLGVWVESEQNLLVLERVLLQDVSSLLGSLASWSNNGLDLSRVDQSSNIGVGDDVGWQGVAGLGAVDGVKSSESRLGPDDESTQVSTWSKLQQVEGLDRRSLDTWNVSESLDKTLVLSVDDQWTSSLDKSSVSQLTLTGSDLLGLDDLDNVLVGTNGLQDSNSFLGLGNGLKVGRDNQWDLRNGLDSVTSGQNKRLHSSGSNSRSSGVSLLVEIHLDVPSSPDLGWSEHTSTSAHVTESSLTRSVGSTTTNSWDSGNSSTGTPRLSGSLVTSVLGDSVSLSLVLVDSGEDRVNDIWSDRSLEDGWKGEGGRSSLTLEANNGNLRSGHCELKDEKSVLKKLKKKNSAWVVCW
ncbi:hypothetical protein OGAPHI_002007 [Ogataea philodendri]|uniref:Uncharacterized protein n=1 Tax=Ogataea philodendri TaxID=1378263 RepID=A0A9P8T6M0_9ASCO|nr:uncharacterized protein OGAPHI_002007 [Ogataea philodendri]KAH3668253.1 hypothetical protein OGAPHI_002007 [Ogataea philodendri]